MPATISTSVTPVNLREAEALEREADALVASRLRQRVVHRLAEAIERELRADQPAQADPKVAHRAILSLARELTAAHTALAKAAYALRQHRDPLAAPTANAAAQARALADQFPVED
jgi:hypothetical protein